MCPDSSIITKKSCLIEKGFVVVVRWVELLHSLSVETVIKSCPVE